MRNYGFFLRSIGLERICLFTAILSVFVANERF